MKEHLLTKKEFVKYIKQALLILLGIALLLPLKELILKGTIAIGTTIFGGDAEINKDLEAIGNILSIILITIIYIKAYRFFKKQKFKSSADVSHPQILKTEQSCKKQKTIAVLLLVFIIGIFAFQQKKIKETSEKLTFQESQLSADTPVFTNVPVVYNRTTGEIFPIIIVDGILAGTATDLECLWSWNGDHGLGGTFITDASTVPLKEERMGSGMITADVVCTNSLDGWFYGRYSDFDI